MSQKTIALLVVIFLVCCGKGEGVDVQSEPYSSQKSIGSPIPLLWDDDGSPDGVIALLYFLQHPGVDVKAITVSCGLAHPRKFIKNLARMLSLLGETDIPVAAGRSTPLKGNNAFPESWRKNSDDFWQIQLPELEAEPIPAPAARLIVDVVNRSPGAVTIFVSGTHTNLAEALRLDPRITAKIRVVESMGGALQVPGNIRSQASNKHKPVSEWNIWIDPLAAQEIFESGIPINLTPLDAAQNVTWKKSDVENWKRTNKPAGVLAARLLQWMMRSMSPNKVYIWDLVAAVNAAAPDLCEHQQFHLKVITESGNQEGRTIIDWAASPNTTVCISPNEYSVKRHTATIFSRP